MALLKHCLGMLAAAALVVGVAPAQAELVRFVNPTPVAGCVGDPSANCFSAVDVGALGFGAAPRMLTLQSTGQETSQSGASVPTAIDADGATGGAIVGADKTGARTLGSLGWLGASQFAIAYDSDQSGNTGITLNQLTLNLYNVAGTAIIFTASLDPTLIPIQYTVADLALQQGNGNGLFIFVLDTPERLALNAVLLGIAPALRPLLQVGLFASEGCPNGFAGCQESNDGPDSFVAVVAGTPVINPNCTDPELCSENPPGTPIPGAVWLFGGGLGLFAMFSGRRKRKQKSVWEVTQNA